MISQALIPRPKKKKTVFLKERTLLLFATLNDSNIDDRGHDLRQVSRIVNRKLQSGIQRPSSTAEQLQFSFSPTDCKTAVPISVSTSSCDVKYF